jgi:hypothetical protein
MSHEALSIKPVNQDNSANAVGEVARVEEPLKKDFYTEGQTRLPIQYKRLLLSFKEKKQEIAI